MIPSEEFSKIYLYCVENKVITLECFNKFRQLDSQFIDKQALKQEIGKINIYHKKKLSGDSIMKKPSEIIKEVLKLLE